VIVPADSIPTVSVFAITVGSSSTFTFRNSQNSTGGEGVMLKMIQPPVDYSLLDAVYPPHLTRMVSTESRNALRPSDIV
jgi:hypothetical protein